MVLLDSNQKLLLACVGGSVIAYNAVRLAGSLLRSSCDSAEWVPVGTVSQLLLYPIKSSKPKTVFSFFCDAKGARHGETIDRGFVIVDEKSGKFYTQRTHGCLALLEADVIDGILRMKGPDGVECSVDVRAILAAKARIIRATLNQDLQADGVDCGDEAAAFVSTFIGEKGARLLAYADGLFNGRPCVSHPDWWAYNPVPKRRDTVAYPDLSPYMITTEASLDDLNSRLDKKTSNVTWRGNIVVDKCAAWDEDKWLAIRIGDAELECFRPCTRCIMVNVDPETGVRDESLATTKGLKTFRLAPEGTKMAEIFMQKPIFGVKAGLVRPGHVHVGQTVWAKYKPSAF